MPAASLTILLNFEGQLAYAAQSILEAGGFTTTSRRGNNAELADTFTAVTIDIGEATGRLGLRPEGVTDHAMYSARLGITVAVARKTNEPAADATGTLADQRCAAIRALFLNHPNPFAAWTEYVQVISIRPLGTEYELDTGTEADTRKLQWELQFVIPDSAWPAVA